MYPGPLELRADEENAVVAAVSPSWASVSLFLLAHRPDRFRFFTDFLLAAHTECSLAFRCSPSATTGLPQRMAAFAPSANSIWQIENIAIAPECY
jgi:hypothetical protein